MKRSLARLISTFFYLGDFPFASGTLASAAAVLLVLGMPASILVYVAVTIAVTVIGIWAAGITEKEVGKKDPSCVVIDEVAGVLVSFFLVPLSWPVIIIGFFLFRAFDMFKIPPADSLENEGGGKGIVLDDIAAGVYTNLTLQAGIWLAAHIR